MKLFGKPLELLVLDVDGVILALVGYFEQSFEAAARAFDLPLEPFRTYLTALRSGARRGHASLSEGVREFWPWLSPEDSYRFALQFQEERRKRPWPAIPGSREVISQFRAQGVALALCTTNDRMTTCHQLSAAGISPAMFASIVTWESRHRKPDPRAFDEIFSAVVVPRQHSAYAGDWYPDLEMARGAGVPFIAVLSGGVPRHAFLREGVAEDHILERLADLPKLITE